MTDGVSQSVRLGDQPQVVLVESWNADIVSPCGAPI